MDWSHTSDYESEDGNSTKVEMKKTFNQKLFPSGFKKELKCLLEIFFPCVLTSLFRCLNPAISVIMCGNLTKVEFDAASLANSLIYVFGVSIDTGFSTAFDTLFAQIYGCGQKKKMGCLLQKAMVIMTLVYLLLACFYLNIEPILILIKQNPLVSEFTARYLVIYLPGLFFDFQFLTMSRYLQNQDILYPTMISAFSCNIFNALSQYIAIYVYGYGLDSSAFLQGVSCFVMFAIQLGYILVSKVYKETWDGFSIRDMLENWKIIFRLGIPGILMFTLEEINFEIVTIIAGTLDLIQLGAQSIVVETSTIALISTVGLEIAVTMRIGQYLGYRNIDRLKTYFRISIVLAFCISLGSFLTIFFLRKYISALFSKDLEIQNEGSDLLIYLAVLQFFDIIAGVGSGVIKACGHQYQGACIMFVCYYIIGIPLGIILVYVFKLKIKGMWIGLIVALFIEGSIFSILIHRLNWIAECDKALDNTEYFNDEDFREIITEKTPLLYKLNKKDKDLSKQQYQTTSLTRTLSSPFFSKNYHIRIPQSFKKTVILRLITIGSVLFVFVGFLLVRIYIPKYLYLPCFSLTNSTIEMYGNYFEILCNSTI